MMSTQTFKTMPVTSIAGNNHLIDARDEIEGHLKKYARHSLAILLKNPGARMFVNDMGNAIGITQSGRHVIAIGGLMGPEAGRADLLAEFQCWCSASKLRPMFAHFPMEDVSVLNAGGFRVNQIGASYSIDLRDYKMQGGKFSQLRNKINKAHARGVSIEEICSNEEFMQIRPNLEAINAEWLNKKKAKQIKIFVTDFNAVSINPDTTRLLIAKHDGQIIAYVIYTKTHGKDAGWFHNLSRHRKSIPDGTMQAINKNFIDSLATVGGYLHLGFTPLVEMDADIGEGSKAFTTIARYLSSKGGVVYPARSQRQYKNSWRPNQVSPEYLAYKGNPLRAIFSLLLASNSI